jgi:hypothetical protein
MSRDALAKLWIWFADNVGRDYSPIYDRVSRTVAETDEVLDLIDQAPPRSHQPNVLLAAVHYLLLGGLDHPLAAVYEGTSNADPGPLFIDVCLTHWPKLLELLKTRHTNTNEVGRSAILAVALSAVGDRLGAPLGFVDVGCSAGLNLMCDHYRIDYGAFGATGPADAAVRIDCTVTGGAPPIQPLVPEISARVGLDRDPVDLTDDTNVRWQLALVFPDTGRLPRTRIALDAIRHSQPQIVAGDAAEKVKGVVLGVPGDGPVAVTTTWAAAYFSAEGRVAFREQLAEASKTRPVAWVSAEGEKVIDLFADIEAPFDAQGAQASLLGLATFRDGKTDAELLGFVHPHGNWIDWRAS